MRLRITIRGAVAGERHKLDAHGVFPGRVTEWTRGGLSGSSVVDIETSRDGGAAWAPVRNATGLPFVGGAVEAADYEAPPDTPVLYRARTRVTEPLPLASEPSESLQITGRPRTYWLKAPLDPRLNQRVEVADLPEWVQGVDVAVFEPLAGPDERVTPSVVVYGAADRGARNTLTVRTYTKAERESVLALLTSRQTLLLQGVSELAGEGGEFRYVAPTGPPRERRLITGRFPYREISVDVLEVPAP